MKCNKLPAERIKVFISSAQSNENGFAWIEARRKIKNCLNKCPYLNPFIIEDVASGIPSTQLYEYQVQQSDMVVLLVKGELRKGTATEFAVATKTKKPLLVYFINDDNPDIGVSKLKKDIQNTDYCTYHQLTSFDNAETAIRNEIIEDVVRYYQFKHFKSNATEKEVTLLGSNETEPSKLSTPTKVVIDMFLSSYDHIYDLLNLQYLKQRDTTSKSELHDLGEYILGWLVLGEFLNCDDKIVELIEKTTDLYESTEWLVKRWDAIRHRIRGEFEAALISEKAALTAAKEANIPSWIINDILIDCRNFENEINYQKHIVAETESQKQLNELETIVYLPVLDRYLEGSYEDTIKEEIKLRTQPYSTITFGTNLGTVISGIENYLFSAMIYGSFVHLSISRVALARVIYKYGKMADDNSLIFSALKLYLLSGNIKAYKQIALHEWESIYSIAVSNADLIWKLTDSVDISAIDAAKQATLKLFGLYLSDEIFSAAENYIFGFANNVYWGNSEDYFDCINGIIRRLDQSRVIVALSSIIKDQRFHLGGKLSNIIMQLHFDNVSIDLQEVFCEVIKEKLPFIVENNGTPQLIASLICENADVFRPLESVANNGLTGIQRMFFDINTGKGNWCDILAEEIEIAKKHFEVNKNPNSYSESFLRPYSMISMLVKEQFSKDIEKMITAGLFPLCIEIMSSKAPLTIKDECMMCLCEVLALYTKNAIPIPEDLKVSICTYKADDDKSFDFFSLTSKATVSYRNLMLRIIIGAVDKDELFSLCFTYAKQEDSARIVLAECISVFLRHCINVDEIADLMLLSIVFQLCEDKLFNIRQTACECLAYLLTTKYQDQIELKLYEMAIDPSPYVRNYLIRICKDKIISIKEVADKLIASMKNDANYAIKKYASSIKES